MKTEEYIKLVLVGDTLSGKTRLIKSILRTINKKDRTEISTDTENKHYTPTLFDSFRFEYSYDKKYLFNVFDTAGSEDYDKIRKLSYPHTDVFLICYDPLDKLSFINVKKKWIPEVEDFKQPVILLGFVEGREYTNEEKESLIIASGAKKYNSLIIDCNNDEDIVMMIRHVLYTKNQHEISLGKKRKENSKKWYNCFLCFK